MPAILFLPYSSDYLVENQMTLITYFILNFEILITKYYTNLKRNTYVKLHTWEEPRSTYLHSWRPIAFLQDELGD